MSSTKGKNYDVTKFFLQGLIYPSILGTFLMDLINRTSEIAEAGGLLGYFTGMTWLSSEKLLLTFAIIFFFCVDYIYNYVTKSYPAWYILFDSVVIGCCLISFNSINILKGSQPPNPPFIIFSFVFFQLMYLIWDMYLTRSKKVQEKLLPGEVPFYKKFIKWEQCIIIALAFIFIAWRFFGLHEKWTNMLTGVVILTSGIFYLTQVSKKKEFEMEKERRSKEELQPIVKEKNTIEELTPALEKMIDARLRKISAPVIATPPVQITAEYKLKNENKGDDQQDINK